ncbi:hypothetical protein MLD38_011554 [Melastoma candidum]|uniref:Uncharacterized protein n=1 Tax=Melastoma candidum TaxID=119954 RepID=A0ACB9R7J8_9MYRT|nr:hypothetical protein MLD38_011554 [Melastoma candidum]
MDHRALTGCYRNHTQSQGRNLPVDMMDEFCETNLGKGWRSFNQDGHFQNVDGTRFGCIRCGDHSNPLQQQAVQRSKKNWWSSSSGMQAVFLSGSHPHSHSTKGSTGTGVFLPSRTRNAMEPTKKSGCSTVLLPAGVIQALKLHFDRMDRQVHSHSNMQHCSGHCCNLSQHDAMAQNRGKNDNSRQRQRFQMATVLWSQDNDDSYKGLLQ